MLTRIINTMGDTILTKCLSSKARRICFLSTLAVKCGNNESLERKEALKKLNTAMNLTSDLKALLSPSMFADNIWKNTGFFSDDDFDTTATAILHSTPKWLKYGSDGMMRNDLKRLWSAFNKTHSKDGLALDRKDRSAVNVY